MYVLVFSIMNSLVIVLFLSGMVAMIMLRTLHKDIARYNQVDQVQATSTLHMCMIVTNRLAEAYANWLTPESLHEPLETELTCRNRKLSISRHCLLHGTQRSEILTLCV